jgi:protein-S-isoprenylcysteine O-methyltransferase Ste14
MSNSVKRILISLLLPFVFLIGFPIAAFLFNDTQNIDWLLHGPQGQIASIIGVFLIVIGLVLVLATIPFFLRQSSGTNMPWDPAPELIVTGIYRYVRNPMHIGVFSIMMGEGLILRSISILGFVTFAIILHLFYIPFSEERGLEKRFGEEYLVYKENVPRWIPRLTPWNSEDK